MPDNLIPKPEHHLYFVTGKLAEGALTKIVNQLAQQYGFDFTIGKMPITVAALMTPKWLLRHLDIPAQATHVILPGYCKSEEIEIQPTIKKPVFYGPKDCRELPEWFGGSAIAPDLSEYRTEIIAEINHCPRMPIDDVIELAKTMRQDGADVIDIGCDPAERCTAIGDYVAAIVDLGMTVSIDTFDSWEAQRACDRGASLVLSVNSTNRNAAIDWGCEVVVVPDFVEDKKSFVKTINFLSDNAIQMRLDPILEPIGAGLAASLKRYMDTRREYPEHRMMMGIGNLTELTDVDSAGLNMILLGICEELSIDSVLTTQVINWGRSSIRECDIARRLAYYSVKHGIPPKRLSDQLVILRDPMLRPYPDDGLSSLASSIKDNHYRLFAQDQRIHLLSAGLHLTSEDPFELFEQLMQHPASDNVDPSHAFYLGFEMAKASTALQLRKQYEQDQSLNWGFLTQTENLHRLKRASRHRP